MLLLAGRLRLDQAFFRGSEYYFSKYLFCLNSMEGLIVAARTLTNKNLIITTGC